MIDLRSDTVTLPSPAMRAAMNDAELGDDVYGEDPTVNRLEALATELVGKEAAMLVPSGTMGNLAALLTHAQRGQRVICGDESHIYYYEAGGASALGGLIYHTLPTAHDGSLPLDAVQNALVTLNDPHRSPPGVFCLENTHNRCGGTVLPVGYMEAAYQAAHAAEVPLHLDGARIFNAAIALGVEVRTLTRYTDSVQFCLSKGLAAPVGSILAGTTSFISKARRVRKMLGGGMRQAGVIAAAGLVALTEMVDRLAEDHANARILAEGLADLPGLTLDHSLVQTAIVRFEVTTMDASSFLKSLRSHGVLMISMGGTTIRAVPHYGISQQDIYTAINAVRAVLKP